jgi:type IV pilus assembly protein PilB
MAVRLGELLVSQGVVSTQDLDKALTQQKAQGGRLGQHLVTLGIVTEDQISEALARQFGIPAVSLRDYEIDPKVLKLVPVDVARKYLVLPLTRVGATLTLAMADPTNVFAIDDIKFMTGYNVEPVVCCETGIFDAVKKFYGGGGTEVAEFAQKEVIDGKDYSFQEADLEGGGGFEDAMENESVVDVEDFDSLVHGAVENVEVVEDVEEESLSGEVDAPIVKLVNGILIKAIKMGVSDIHIEPYEKSFRVRYRLDGVLRKAMGLPLKIKPAIISRVKIMSRLDIAERRLPQDGRIKMKLGKKREMDFRVSVCPTLHGEKIVMRLLDKGNLQLDMSKLGFEPESEERFHWALKQPYGMILVTGPTGSGKTTTLYSALHALNEIDVNIMTAEDPVEFNLQGINQVQMHEEIGLNFSAALRSFLRQDPDIIMVGEIRDYETAEIGVKAALTGHLVLSTLHTNDAPSTINRMLNMGIEPFLVTSSVVLIMAQRLARKVCVNCKEKAQVNPVLLEEMGFPKEELSSIEPMKGQGCMVCSNTGYKGRVALYEVLKMSDGIRDIILRGGTNQEIKQQAISEGMITMRMSGLRKIRQGVTTVEEVLRSTFAD